VAERNLAQSARSAKASDWTAFVSIVIRTVILGAGTVVGAYQAINGRPFRDWIPWLLAGNFMFWILTLVEARRKKQIKFGLFLILSQAVVIGTVVIAWLTGKTF
jgi:hypothetical protein